MTDIHSSFANQSLVDTRAEMPHATFTSHELTPFFIYNSVHKCFDIELLTMNSID